MIGLVLIGAGFQHHLSIGVFIVGWGLAEVATMVNTVAVCTYVGNLALVTVLICALDAYISDCFPNLQVCSWLGCSVTALLTYVHRAKYLHYSIFPAL